MSHAEDNRRDDRPELGYESTDANPKVLAYAFVALSLLIIFTFVAMWLLFVYFDSKAEKSDRGRANPWGNVDYRPPEPRLQTSPNADLRKMLDHENHLMQSYGWVNKASGIVRIPVARAMDIVAKKGLPNLPQIGAPEDTPNPFSTPAMATKPVATGTDTNRPPASLGGPPANQKEPMPPPSRTGGATQTPPPNGGNRKP